MVIGQFSAAGRIKVNGSIAHYNGWYWDSNYGVELTNGYFSTLCSTGSYLILGGDFTYKNSEGNAISYLLQSNGILCKQCFDTKADISTL